MTCPPEVPLLSSSYMGAADGWLQPDPLGLGFKVGCRVTYLQGCGCPGGVSWSRDQRQTFPGSHPGRLWEQGCSGYQGREGCALIATFF